MISQEQFEQLRPGDWIQFEMEKILLEVADLQVAGRQIICWAPRHFKYGLYVGFFDAYKKNHYHAKRFDEIQFSGGGFYQNIAASIDMVGIGRMSNGEN